MKGSSITREEHGALWYGAVALSRQQRAVLVVVVALGYAALLAIFPDERVKDFDNYIVYGANSWEMLMGRWSQGLLATLANEPLWLLVNAGLSSFLGPEEVVRGVIFMSAFTVAATLLHARPSHWAWVVFILLFPMLIKSYVIHLRQGMAIAVFVLGWFSERRTVRTHLMLAAPFLHASFFFIVVLMLISRLMRMMRLDVDVRVIVALGLSVSLGFLLSDIASMVGARQANEYQFSMAEVSGAGFLLWLSVLGLMALEGRRFLRAHVLEASLLTFYLGTYWLVEIAARVLESGIVLILLAGLKLSGLRRLLFVFGMPLLGGAIWLKRSGDPLFGFGFG